MAKAEPDSKKVRRLKISQPLTLRQEIEKQHAEHDQAEHKPVKAAKAGSQTKWRRWLSRPFRWLGRQLGRLAKPLRFMRRPLRLAKKLLGIDYFVSSWQELRQVSWPNRRQTWQLTSAVIIFSVIFGLLLAGVDKGLDVVFKHILTK